MADTPRRSALWVPLFVFVLGSAAAVLLWRGLEARERDDAVRGAALAARAAAHEIGARLESQVLSLARIARRHDPGAAPSRRAWETEAALHLADAGGYLRAINWVDPSLRVRWKTRRSGSEEPRNLDLGRDPAIREALLSARARGGPTLTGPLQLADGGRGFFVCVPIARGAAFAGFVLGVVDDDDLLRSVLHDDFAEGYSLAVWHGDEEVFRRAYGRNRPRPAGSWIEAVDLHGQLWRVQAWPGPDLLPRTLATPSRLTLAGGLFTAMLLALMTYFARAAARRAVAAERLARELRHEIGERGRVEDERDLWVRRLSDATFEAVVMHQDGTILDVNQTFATMFGYRRDDVIGMPLATFIAPESRELLEATIGSGSDDPIELVGRRRDDTRLILMNIGKSMPYRGRPVRVSILHDITERRRTEQALRERESLRAASEYARSLIEASVDPLVTIAADGTITDVNRATERVTGVPRERLIGTDFCDYCVEPERARHAWEQAFAQGSITEYPLAIRHASGSVTDVLYNASVYADARGTVQGVFASARDITERKRIDRMKDELISTVSHEIRTPLTSIHGVLGILAAGAAGTLPDQARSLLEIGRRNSERLTRLVDAMLDLGRIGAGQLTLNVTAAAILPLVEKAIGLARVYGDRRDVLFALAPGSEAAIVSVDPERLVQALTNILTNASKFTPAGDTVSVGVRRRPGQVRIAVTDHGPGIPESFRERIFQSFAQADASDTRVPGGTGLGLSLTRALVRGMNGDVGFDTAPGGTTFWIDVPEHAGEATLTFHRPGMRPARTARGGGVGPA